MIKQMLKSSVIIATTVLAGCSTMKDMTNVDLWPFGKKTEHSHDYQPANSIPYSCEGNKKFYVRYLDKGASVWLILPDREVGLAQVGSTKIYSNGITKIDLTGTDVTLEINETTKYLGCQSKSIATVSKVETPPVQAKIESKPEAKPALKAEAKSEAKETSEKGWFDWMKFWESDDKPKQAEPVKSVEKAKPVEVAKVAEPLPVEATAKAVTPAVQLEEIKAVEPVEEAPKVELATEVSEPNSPAEEQVAAQDDVQSAVGKTVEAWANAWRTKDASAYLNLYSAKFAPEGMSRKAWAAQRQQRVGANPGEITLTLDKLSIVADAKKATATFAQHYASGKYSDDVVKVLSFENVNGQWLIVKESAKAAAK